MSQQVSEKPSDLCLLLQYRHRMRQAIGYRDLAMNVAMDLHDRIASSRLRGRAWELLKMIGDDRELLPLLVKNKRD